MVWPTTHCSKSQPPRPNWKALQFNLYIKALHHFQPRHPIHRIHRRAPRHAFWPPSEVPTGAELVLHCAWDRWKYASPAHVGSLEVWGWRLAMKKQWTNMSQKPTWSKTLSGFIPNMLQMFSFSWGVMSSFIPWSWLSFWNVATTFREFSVLFSSRSWKS